MNLNKAMNGLKLYTELSDDKLLTLSFGVYKNMFRVYINKMDKDYKNNEFITSLALTSIVARMISNELNDLWKLKETYQFEQKLFGAKYVDDKRVINERVKTGSFKIMKAKNKDDDLVNVIQITDKLDKKYNFVITKTPYIEIYKNNEKVTDATVISDTWCRSFAKTYSDVMTLVPEGFDTEIKTSF